MESKQVNIAIKKIKDIEFFVNEQAALPLNGVLNISFNVTTQFNIEDNTVEIILNTLFTTLEKNEEVMKIKTTNLFWIKELSEFLDTKKGLITVPDNLMITLLSLSVSHTRALLAKNALGTKFSEFYLPIVNPADLYKKLFQTNAGK